MASRVKRRYVLDMHRPAALGVFALLWVSLIAHAQNGPRFRAGVVTSLEIESHQFLQPEAILDRSQEKPDSPPLGRGSEQREFFARATLTNRGRTPLVLAASAENPAGLSWNFRVFNSEGVEVWQTPNSLRLLSMPVVPGVPVAPGRALTTTLRIPLVVEGAPLPPGRYQLEAFLPADQPIVVSVPFTILPRLRPPQPHGEVVGTVLRPARNESGNLLPASRYRVTITSLLSSDSGKAIWSGETDSKGNFRAVLPPGAYRATATPQILIMIYPPPPGLIGSTDFEVSAGQTTEVLVVLGQTSSQN